MGREAGKRRAAIVKPVENSRRRAASVVLQGCPALLDPLKQPAYVQDERPLGSRVDQAPQVPTVALAVQENGVRARKGISESETAVGLGTAAGFQAK